jgi:hypothetical protein
MPRNSTLRNPLPVGISENVTFENETSFRAPEHTNMSADTSISVRVGPTRACDVSLLQRQCLDLLYLQCPNQNFDLQDLISSL